MSSPLISAADAIRLGLEGYRTLVRRPIPFVRLAGPWLVVSILLGAFGPGHLVQLFPLVGWCASAAVSVAWSRLMLLSVTCPVGGNLGRRERRYILTALPMVAMSVLVVTACYFVAEAAGAPFDDLVASPWFLWLTTALALLAYHISISRFVLIFPAIAVDNGNVGFRASLRLTRGSAVAIFMGILVVSVPAMIPSVAYWLPENELPGAALAVADGLDISFSLISAVVVATFSAQLYVRQFGTVASVFE